LAAVTAAPGSADATRHDDADDRLRPDGSNYTWSPSGHALVAFSSATVVAEHDGANAGAAAYAPSHR
jgi:hypothetical protein